MKTCTSILEAQAVPGVVFIWAGPPVIAYELGDVIPSNELPSAVDPKAVMWEAIKAQRDLLSDTGGYKVTVGGVPKWFHSDGKSKTQQLSLFIMGASVPAVPWKTMDGSFVTMTQALAAQIFQAAAAQDQAIFTVAEQHRAAMMASADPASYDYMTDWPAVFGG